MRFAQELGYFHYNQMLRGVSAREFAEVMACFRLDAESKKATDRKRAEIKARKFFDAKIENQE